MDINQQFVNFVTMYDRTHKKHWACLVGALAASHDTLSADMQKKLKEMAEIIVDWLTNLLTLGLEKGVFSFREDPKTKAYLIQSSLLASLLLDKVMGNKVYQLIQNGLLNK